MGLAVVVGEGIVVVAVEGFDRSEDRGRRIHQTVGVVPGPKPKESKRTIISIGDLVDRESRRRIEEVQQEGNGKSTRFFALSDNTRFTRLHPSLFSSGKAGFRQSEEQIGFQEGDLRPRLRDLHGLVEGVLEQRRLRRDPSPLRLGR